MSVRDLLEVEIHFAAPNYRFEPRLTERRDAQRTFIRGELNSMFEAARERFLRTWAAFTDEQLALAQAVIDATEGFAPEPPPPWYAVATEGAAGLNWRERVQ